jgi:hypothetical protein
MRCFALQPSGPGDHEAQPGKLELLADMRIGNGKGISKLSVHSSALATARITTIKTIGSGRKKKVCVSAEIEILCFWFSPLPIEGRPWPGAFSFVGISSPSVEIRFRSACGRHATLELLELAESVEQSVLDLQRFWKA